MFDDVRLVRASLQDVGFKLAVYPEELPGGLQNCLYMIRD